nr:Hint domain-containing protein [Pseudomonas putida]
MLTEKGPCCFAAGTKVSTPNGDRAIESLKVGDVVWSKPEKGGKPFAAKILATHQRSDQPIYRLKLKNLPTDGTAKGETLLVTPSHPFYVPAKRDFIPALDLKPGDLLQSLADGDSENTSSQVEALELYLPVGQTYNLTVDVGHTFYVGELKTWVHNTGPCDLPEWPVGAKGGGSSGFSGGKPTVVGDPSNPNAVTERSSANRDYYGPDNAADEFSAGLPDYATHSTAKSYQSTAPRDLNEQTLWNRVIENPSAGRDTKLAGDKDFPRSEGWRKMEVSHRLPSGENITIHYQYNSVTGNAYDVKITTPQQLPPVLQPGRTIE